MDKSCPGCSGPVQRNTRSRGGGSVSSSLHPYPGLVSISPGCFQHCSPLHQLGLICRSASPWPPAPAAPNAARTCPHLHSKVNTNPPLKQVTVKLCEMCINRVIAVLAAAAMLKGNVSGSRTGDTNGL